MENVQVLWFLPFVIPICIYVAYWDMKGMIIPNKAVIALFVTFIVVGFFAFPDTGSYLWRFAHFAIILALGIVMNAARLLGAGDAKFMAAAAPLIALADLGVVTIIFLCCLLAGFFLHRIAKASPLRRLAPDWKSWDAGRRFPMGMPLALTLVSYLVWTLVQTPAATA